MEDSLAESQKQTDELQTSLQNSESENMILKSEITQLTDQSVRSLPLATRLCPEASKGGFHPSSS